MSDEKLRSVQLQNEELKIQNGQLIADFTSTKQSLDSAKIETQTARAENDALQSQIRHLTNTTEKHEKQQAKVSTLENDNERLASKIQLLNSEIDNLHNSKSRVEQDLLTATKDLAALQMALTEKSTALDDATEELEGVQLKYSR